jgi:hypothetical protein
MVGLDVLSQAVPRLEDLAAGLALHAGVHVLGRVATHSTQSIKFNINKTESALDPVLH